MVKIRVLTNFRHAGVQFYEGEIRIVTDAEAGYFCGVGWAAAEGHVTGEPDLSEKKLEVISSKHATKGVIQNG